MSERQEETEPKGNANQLPVTWMITVGFAFLAALITVSNFVVFAANGLGKVLGWPPLFVGFEHFLWLSLAILCIGIAVASHMINLRFHQLSEHVYPVELEEPVIAESRGGRVEDRIRSHANIIIELSQPDLAVTINADMPLVRRMLENGMSIATSDPVARFSKPKIEEILRLSLSERYKLTDIHRVVLSSMRQERMAPNFQTATAPKVSADPDLTGEATDEISAPREPTAEKDPEAQ